MSLQEFLHSKARASRHEPVRFDLRPYQQKGARDARASLARRRNVIIDLPTGAGKTNIALLCTAQVVLGPARALRPGRQPKVLYVVPTRILIGQVAHAASWLSPEIYRVPITPQLAANRFDLRAAVERADLVITTPGLFASLLRRGAVDKRALMARLAFVVVDEFDEFLTIDPTEASFAARFEDDFRELRRELPEQPMLLMSGTAPKTAAERVHSFTAQMFAAFVDQHLRPITLRIPEKTYRRFIPVAHVHCLGTRDPFVIECDAALKHQQQRLLTDFECVHDLKLDWDHFMDRLAAVATRFVKRVRLPNGRFVDVQPAMMELARRLLAIVNKYTFLFDDLFAGFDVERRGVPLIVNCVVTDSRIEVPILVDQRADSEFWPALRAKAGRVLQLIKERDGQKGVVMTRHVRLADALASRFSAARIPVLQLDGRLGEAQRFTRLRQFAAPEFRGVLIITRTTGKRGLDIPAADYAAIYSPKEDEYVVWQELSRIRSTLAKGKDSYIFYYEDTADAAKLSRLEHAMRGSANRYVFRAE